MKLINKTTRQIISSQLKIAASWFDASTGLLNEPKGTAMLFYTRWGIHTFGMKYPIDVVVLDHQLRIVKIKKNLLPNRFFFWNPLYSSIIELPKNQNLSLNDLLKIDP